MLSEKRLFKGGRLTRSGQWWDLWDIDIDYDQGKGKASRAARKRELLRAAELLKKSIAYFDQVGRGDVQVWLMLHSRDSREDRLYFHSANNANGTPWPSGDRSGTRRN